jgi:tryptophan-rich sensory protein
MLFMWLCRAGWERQAVPLAVYGVQLLLNFLWTPLFFKVHRLDLASADIAGEAATRNNLLYLYVPPQGMCVMLELAVLLVMCTALTWPQQTWQVCMKCCVCSRRCCTRMAGQLQ